LSEQEHKKSYSIVDGERHMRFVKSAEEEQSCDFPQPQVELV